MLREECGAPVRPSLDRSSCTASPCGLSGCGLLGDSVIGVAHVVVGHFQDEQGLCEQRRGGGCGHVRGVFPRAKASIWLAA